MSTWIYIAGAVLANIATNVMLKKMMSEMTSATGPALVMEVVSSFWFWAAAFSGVVLVSNYLLAIRTMGLSTSYSMVTSAALIGITLASAVAFNETLNLPKVAGIVLVISGLWLISQTQSA